MRKCILGCPKGNTLHKFPDDEEKRKEWLKIINMENCPLANLYLCTRHFARRMKGKTRIVWNAKPTLNLLGVDESDIECEEVEHDVDADSPRSTPSSIRRKRKMLVLPNKAKVLESKGKVQTDPLYEPPSVVTEEQLVKYQLKFVDGKALKLSPKSTANKEDNIEVEGKRNLTPKTQKSIRQFSPKTTADNIIKHQLKIVNGKAYKINAPVSSTDKTHDENNFITQTKSRTACGNRSPQQRIFNTSAAKSTLPLTEPIQSPNLMKCASEKLLFRKSLNNASPVSLEYEVVDNIEAMEKQSTDFFMDEFVEDVVIPEENDYTGTLKHSMQNDDVILTEFKADEDSNTMFDIHSEAEQSQTSKCISKEQTIESRSRQREKCGFIERFTNNNTFCLTCFHCDAEFELWDWQQFIEHVNEEHIPKRRPYLRNKNKLECSSESESQKNFTSTEIIKEQVYEDEFLTPKLEEVQEEVEAVEMSFEENIEHVLKENVENLEQEEDSNETYNDTMEDDYEMCDEEDWQVDKLEEYEDIQIYEDNTGNIGDVDVNDEEEEDVGEEEDELDNKNEDSISQAVINLKTTDPTRVLEFLNLLRAQPVLWHPRRYGPSIYDEEMQKFLNKFNNSMSPLEFRRSVEYLRCQYKRFTPLTSRGRAKLQQDDYLRECVQIIKEIADKLSKPFAFHCNICRYFFLDENRMLTHKYLKHKIGDLKYICSCGIRFAYERQKEEHENLHKQKPRFTCKLCGSHFIFNRLLRDHMNEYHPETQENPMPYTCDKCGAKFPTILKRAHHMERHKIPQYHCELCNQSYKSSFRFKHHLKRHQGERDWVCEHCGKAFVERRSLNAHRFRVHRDGGFKCVHCRTYFAGKDSLDAHNQKFHPDGTNLDRMKKIRKYFNSKYKKNNSEAQNKRVFKCKECGELFKQMWLLVGHKRETGHDLQAYNCPQCEAVLSSPKTLMGHMQRIHKLPVTTIAELRNFLLNTVEEESLTVGEEEMDENVDEGLKLEEIEIFEAYDIE